MRNQNVTKLKSGAKKAAASLYGRLNLGGEAIIAPPAGDVSLKKIDAKRLARAALSASLSLILAFGRMAFGTRPLALALIASSSRLAPVMALGASFGSLLSGGGDGYVYSYALLIVLRFLFAFRFACGGEKKFAERIRISWASAFSESLYVRMALSIPCAFLAGVYALARGGFYPHDLAGLLFLTVFTPVAVYIFSGAFDAAARETKFYLASVAALLFSLVYSLRGYSLFGVALASGAAFFIIMYAARSWGQVAAALTGLLVGFAISPIHAPLLALAGITAGVIARRSIPLAAVASSVVSASLGFFLLGFSSLFSLLPAAAIGCTAFSLLYSSALLPDVALEHASRVKADAAEFPDKKHRALKEQLEELSDAFSSVSEIFTNLSLHVRVPSVAELREVCDGAFDRRCAECRCRIICWEREYFSSADAVNKLAVELHSRGRASDAVLPDHIKERCTSLGAILDDINRESARVFADSLGRERAGTVAADYGAFSSVIAEAIARNEDEFAHDDEFSRRLSLAFEKRAKDFPVESVSVRGERQKHVLLSGVGAAAIRCSMDALKSKVAEIVGEQITEPALELSGEKINLYFDIEPRYRVESAHAILSAEGGVCGDTVSDFRGANCYFYSLISDGMGCGKSAALASGICSVFLERLLSCGMRPESALKMLSVVLRAKNIECSATVDLAEFDLIRGKVTFVKSGAAPSFVRRGGKLFRLDSKTIPVGILRSLDAEEIRFDLESGDVIIMLSDGVCEDVCECAWLPALLVDGWEDDLDAMAEKIVRESGVRRETRDDVSVGIVRVV